MSEIESSHTAEKPESSDVPETPLEPGSPPREVELTELQGQTFPELLQFARDENIRIGSAKSRRHLLLDISKGLCARGVRLIAEGIIEIMPDHSAYLRSERFNFASAIDDIQFPNYLSRQLPMAPGLRARVLLRLPRDRERHVMVGEVLELEGIPLLEWQAPKFFDKLTPLFPKERLILETKKNASVSSRVVDLIAPLGKGQRGLIVAPPRVGKTILLKHIAKSIRANYPEVHLILLLIDERPEEVTDFQREIDADIFSSTFDEAPPRHVQVSELVLERAKRLVELGKDVVILLDSITRLARGYNALQGGKGRIMSGGVESKALLKPKRFFGAARNVEEGGSLTILASALIETGSRMDDVIFEEFKGTGNMELHLDRALTEKRIYPAINILKSGTRKEELLYHPQEFQRVGFIRRQLAAMPMVEAMEELTSLIRATASNAELLMRGLR